MNGLIQKFNALLQNKRSAYDLSHDGTPWGSLEWQHLETEPYWIWWYEGMKLARAMSVYCQ